MIAKLITGSGKPNSGSSIATSLSVEEVAGLRVLQLGDGADVALAEVERRVVLLALQLEERAHPLLALRAEVHERRVGGDRALQHAEEVDAAPRTGRPRS